jgi:carbonic anhydrase
MQKLIRGLHDFQERVFSSQRELFERLAQAGQTPEALFITCSDSRINPNEMTQTQPGEIFILRNAGNLIPPFGASIGGEAATIEYAVAVLGVKDIIVCGHSHCGAMAAALEPPDADALPAVRAWLVHAEATRQIMRANYRHLEGEALANATVEENVLVQLENLRTHPSVRVRLSAGQLKVHGWFYKIESGEVFYYDQESSQFAPLVEATAENPKVGGRDQTSLP